MKNRTRHNAITSLICSIAATPQPFLFRWRSPIYLLSIQSCVDRIANHKMHNFSLIFSLFLLILIQLLNPQYVFSHSIVQFLPGFEGRLPFILETGYIGVGESEDVQLFYYFVKSETSPENDPLIIWFNGGPGCSSLETFAYEIGPINFDTASNNWEFPSLVLNRYSWTKVASIIFLDSPVLTGFSYARTSNATECTDIQASHYAHEFLLKWLIDHPQFISNQFYVAGVSYAGMVVPVLTQIISEGIEPGVKPIINLKGYITGNPITTDHDFNYRIPYSHGMGLISSELYESLKKHCKGDYFYADANNAPCYQDLQTYKKLISRINEKHILEPICDVDYINRNQLFNRRRSLQDITTGPSKAFRCRAEEFILVINWANNPKVQEALHIRKGTIKEWVRCNHHLSFTATVHNSVPYHKNLSIRGYRSLMYSGDHDLVLPFLATEAWIKSLNYSIIDEWRPWMVRDEQVGGYTRTYANQMTFATVKGGGHTAPTYRREECLHMFKRWISYQPL